LGIPDLRMLNLCLLASWVQRYYDAESKLWREIMDCKYQNSSPNLFCCNGRGSSPFWKGVLWSAQIAKMGYRWKIGNGENIKFWEDQLFGSCSLAIQFWEIYSIIHEKGISVKDVWDGINLKVTFRRIVDHRLMLQWEELLQICSSIQFTEERNAII
jgi:hypothetical protein